MRRLLFIPLIFLLLSCDDKQKSIDNNVPVALIVAVTPSVPTLNDSLVLSYFYFDVDGDDESGTTITWYKDDVEQTEFSGQFEISASATACDEEWYAEVTPNDGELFGVTVVSNTILICSANTAPQWSAIDDQHINEDSGENTVDISLYITDAEQASSQIVFHVLENSDPVHLGVVFDGLNLLLTSLVEDYNITEAIILTLQANDGYGGVVTQTANVFIDPVNDAPQFSDIGNQQVHYEGDTLTFTISAIDIENDSISFSIEGNLEGAPYPDLPTEPILTDNNDGTADFSWASSLGDAGNYNVIFRASDGTDYSDEAIVISVGDVNQPPVANAGPDQIVEESVLVTLYGSDSYDPDGQELTYAWTEPDGITLDFPTIADPTFTAPNVTENNYYTFTLVVTDDGGLTATDEVVIIVNNPPVADAGEDDLVNKSEIYQLDGSGSFDPDEDPITYLWIAPDGITLDFPTIADPTFMAPNVTENTDYIFTLIVSDGVYSSAVDIVTITVLSNLYGLYINEFLAINDNNIQDELGGYGDWIEIYNSTNESVNLGGMFLTDSLSYPDRYQIPNGVTINPMGFLLFWADDDGTEGALHTNFNISGFGEEIGLFDMDGTVIDSITFSEQSADNSFGRISDGNTSWVFFTIPTPNSSNGN